jgi:hypothetical protein
MQKQPTAPAAAQIPAAPAAPGSSTSGLHQMQLALQTKVNSLTAQREVLTQQMRTGSLPLRASTEAQLLQVDLDLASTKAELASVQAEIAARRAEPVAPRVV